MGSISKEDFQFLLGFVHREAGIALGADKVYLVESRLEELRSRLELKTLAEVVTQVRQGNPQTTRLVVEAITTNETSFFRDMSPFEGLRSAIIPQLIEQRRMQRRLRIWSAACSTGQEACSIAMTVDSCFARELDSWDVRIVGTDLNEKVLDRARAAEYSQMEVNRGLPAQNLMRYFKKVGGKWVVSHRLRKMMSFEKLNLLNVPASWETFDVIFCRNVLIYFDTETKRKVLDSLVDHLSPDGCLIVGASEVLPTLKRRLERVLRGGAVCHQRTCELERIPAQSLVSPVPIQSANGTATSSDSKSEPLCMGRAVFPSANAGQAIGGRPVKNASLPAC